MSVLVDLQGVGVTMADRTLFADLSVTVHTGDRLGVVGINGTGKSTLLRVLAGRLTPDAGAVRQGRGIRTGLLDQSGSRNRLSPLAGTATGLEASPRARCEALLTSVSPDDPS